MVMLEPRLLLLQIRVVHGTTVQGIPNNFRVQFNTFTFFSSVRYFTLFVTEEINKLYVKTHITLNYGGKNLPPLAAGKLK